MITGSGLCEVQKDFSDRVFDVGISEQHAITFAAGLSLTEMLPFCAIYSTFLQRGYDQVIHDIAIQKLPVRFLIDRAGFVGSDGPTHHGSFDIAMLMSLPSFVIMAPSCGLDLVKMINTMVKITDRPSAVRYPRSFIPENNVIITDELLEIGKGRFVKHGETLAILSFGTSLADVLEADIILKKNNINATVFDILFAKPIDEDAIIKIASNHSIIVSVEDGGFGGVGSAIAKILNEIKYPGSFRALHHSFDNFIAHSSILEQKQKSGIDAWGIVDCVLAIK